MRKILTSIFLLLLTATTCFGQPDYEIKLVKDIYAGTNGSMPNYFVNFDDNVYFVAYDGIHGLEFWRTDGTTAGTQLALDAVVGSGSLMPFNLFSFNNKLYFVGHTLTNGNELWVTDGTLGGTHMVKDINSGTGNSNPALFTVFEDKLYFVANDGIHANELWVTDGTEAGTHIVKDINVGDNQSHAQIGKLIVFNGKLYFGAKNNNSDIQEFWSSDGTEAGTQLFYEADPGQPGLFPSNFCIVDNKLYFSGMTSNHGSELWVTDGTVGGTQMVKDINPGFYTSSPKNLVAFNNKLYFLALTNNEYSWWSSNGTEAGTVATNATLPPTINFMDKAIVFENKIIFKGQIDQYGYQLWYMDENHLINLISPSIPLTIDPLNVNGSHDFFVYNDKLLVNAKFDLSKGPELYVYSKIDTTLTTNVLNSLDDQFSIYPNPTDGRVNIDFSSQIDNGTVSIKDLSGRTIYTTSINNAKTIEIDLLGTSGMYLLYLQTPNDSSVKSITLK